MHTACLRQAAVLSKQFGAVGSNELERRTATALASAGLMPCCMARVWMCVRSQACAVVCQVCKRALFGHPPMHRQLATSMDTSRISKRGSNRTAWALLIGTYGHQRWAWTSCYLGNRHQCALACGYVLRERLALLHSKLHIHGAFSPVEGPPSM